MIAMLCSKSFKLGFSNMRTKNFQIYSWVKKMQRNQRSNCQHSLDYRESRGIQKNHLILLYWLRQSLWLCGSQQTVENSSRDGNTRPLYLCLQKSVCRSRSTVRSGHGMMDWFQIRKGVCQGCILSPCLFNLYAEYIMWNAWLDEAQKSRLESIWESRLLGEISVISDIQMIPP